MHESDWDRIRRAKDAHRDKLAALPFDAKLQILERLRERTLTMTGSPAGAADRQSTSHAEVFLPPGPQSVGHAMSVGVFGVNASLAVAATAQVLSSAAVSTGVTQQKTSATVPRVNPDGRTR